MRKMIIVGVAVLGVAGAMAAGLYYGKWSQGRPAPASVSVPVVSIASVPAPTGGADDAGTAGVPAVLPSFDVVRIDRNGAAVMAGRAEPGARVTVYDGDRPLGSVPADRRGEWVLIPEPALSPGSRELHLSAQPPSAPSGGDGNILWSEQAVVLVVPEPGRDIAGRALALGEQGQALALAVPREGSGVSEVLQVPAVAGKAGDAAGEAMADASAVTVETLDYDEDGHVSLGGSGTPGASVLVYLDNLLVGQAHTDPNGKWKLSPAQPVEPGLYTLRADQVIPGGQVTARVELPVQVVKPPANLGSDLNDGRKVVVQPGNSLWRIARRSYGAGPHYTLIYIANRSQIRNPDLIYPGQIFNLPPVAP